MIVFARSHLNPKSKNVVFSDKSKRVGSLLYDKVCVNKRNFFCRFSGGSVNSCGDSFCLPTLTVPTLEVGTTLKNSPLVCKKKTMF